MALQPAEGVLTCTENKRRVQREVLRVIWTINFKMDSSSSFQIAFNWSWNITAIYTIIAFKCFIKKWYGIGYNCFLAHLKCHLIFPVVGGVTARKPDRFFCHGKKIAQCCCFSCVDIRHVAHWKYSIVSPAAMHMCCLSSSLRVLIRTHMEVHVPLSWQGHKDIMNHVSRSH